MWRDDQVPVAKREGRNKMVQACKKICDILEECGIDHVFGIPGGGTMRIFDALYDHQSKIHTILARHEQGAACMADMYGRLIGKPGVVMGQGAFIGSNAAFGIMEAYMSSSPMLVLTDTSDSGFAQQAYYQCGAGEHGEFDLVGILRSMSEYVTLATTPKEAVHGVQLAIKHATSGRPGPACVVMRSSAIAGEVDLEQPPRVHGSAGYLSTTQSIAPVDDVKNVVELIASAKSPVLISGNGVHASKAYAELQELAETFSLPVATSYKGKSSFAENHPLALGMMGVFGQAAANTIVGEADLLLVVGCRLSPTDTCLESPQVIDPSRQRIIQIDIDPRNAGWTFPVEVGLVGDAKAVLAQMVETARELEVGRPGAGTTLAAHKAELGFFEHPSIHSDKTPVFPQRLVKVLEEGLDPSAIITLDAGNNRIWMAHHFQSRYPGTIFSPGGIAGMGWAAPAALAAKLVHPERQCICVTGDGGFMMSLHVLSTAVQYDLPVVFVVQNNSQLGMVRHHQKTRNIASEFIETDYAKIAEAFGCRGIRVETPQDLPAALDAALNSRLPTVLDVVIDREENLDSIRFTESDRS
jgi:acetolactate synthase-1/2/3 large subunit